MQFNHLTNSIICVMMLVTLSSHAQYHGGGNHFGRTNTPNTSQVSHPGSATESRTPEERARFRTNWMKINAGINEDQGKQFYDIMFKYSWEFDNAENLPAGPDRNSTTQSLVIQRNAAVRKILSDAQYQKYLEHMEELNQKDRDRRAGGGR